MTTRIECPHCKQTYELTPQQIPQYAGQTITCTRCNNAFAVPANIPGAPMPPTYPTAVPTVSYAHPGMGRQPNPLAIISLVFGILGFIIPIIGGGVAIVLGILGIRKTRDPRVGGKGIAIAGLTVGIVSIVINTCMLSILFPSLNRARETANRVKCASNMKQIGWALLMYGNDNRGQYPPDLSYLLLTQDITSEPYVCPSSNDTRAPGSTAQEQAANLLKRGHLSYVYVAGLNNNSAADCVVLYELPGAHAGDGTNMLFADGRVEWVPKPTADVMIQQIEKGQNPPKLR